ncbi:MAG TPA: peroxiredoxin [Polyangiaceae bacterium]|nr:peroxiredoxin [Polyangiaceae bacterium]
MLDSSSAPPHGRFVLSVGDTAPDFEGTDQNGRRVKLDELLEKSAVVLYFYPKDFTPVCTAQACLFRDSSAELTGAGVQVIGVSGDDQSSHSRFAETHRVPYPLLSDPDKNIQKAYEARQLLGLLAKRVTYVIGRDKKIRGVFHHELSAQKHVDAVKKVLASMNAYSGSHSS